MAIGWKDVVNIVIEGLVARLATLEGQVKELEEDKDAVSMVSLTRIKPNPSRTTTNPPPLRMTLIDFS